MNNDMLNAKNEKKNLREYMSDSNTLISFLLTLLAVLAPTFRGSDFLKQLIQLNIDGLLLYQAIFAFLALVAAFFVLLYCLGQQRELSWHALATQRDQQPWMKMREANDFQKR